jgi:alpha-N-acetylglucosaminidase
MASEDPKTVWVLQAWFLSAVPRLPWGLEQVEAFLTAPPQGALLMLDLNAIQNEVWRKTNAFFGQPFIWNMLHNFGEVKKTLC